ncbi:MAG TPA: hypothetical protein VMD59_01315, partial [Acidimicrobiales bacterium]|nr:hypothetical protein [Acidimicrobiales bacterium]
NLDDDVIGAARALARGEQRSLGEVVSDLARRGLAPRMVVIDDEDGFPVFHVGPDAPPITPDMVQGALDET